MTLQSGKSLQYLALYYVKIIFGPVTFNLGMFSLLGVSIYRDVEPFYIYGLVGVFFLLRLIPLSKILRISRAARMGRKDAEGGKDYVNPHHPESLLYKAYEHGYGEVQSGADN